MTGRLLFYFIGYGVAVKRIARIATIAAIAKIVKRENRPEIQITRLPDFGNYQFFQCYFRHSGNPES